MKTPSQLEVTQLLLDWSNGDQDALDKLVPLVYEELRRLARHYMRHETPGHTLQTTALVNEAYLRLVDQTVPWQNRAHFFAIAAQMMRRILIDHARGQRYAKRGGGKAIKVPLEEAAIMPEEQAAELVALDEALTRLSAIDPRRGQVVELRFYGGLSIEETARVLKISANTVMRDWNLAKAWLYQEINQK